MLAHLPPRMHPPVGRAPPHMPRVPRSSATLSTAVDTRCTWVLDAREEAPPLRLFFPCRVRARNTRRVDISYFNSKFPGDPLCLPYYRTPRPARRRPARRRRRGPCTLGGPLSPRSRPSPPGGDRGARTAPTHAPTKTHDGRAPAGWTGRPSVGA